MDMGKRNSVQRLREAMHDSRRRLEPFRAKRMEALSQFVGSNYSDNGAKDRVPVNLLELAISIYQHALSSGNLKGLVTTKHRALKPGAADLELALNHTLRLAKFSESFQRCVLNAIFSIGIAKVGMCRSTSAMLGDTRLELGRIFVDDVDLDDWVHDMSATRWTQVGFMGDRYRVPYEEACNDPSFDRKAVKETGPSDRSYLNEMGDSRAATLSRGEDVATEDEYSESLEVWDLWLPQENMLITLSANDGDDKILRAIDWDGPETGPYHKLSFSDVPQNVMPVPPVATLMDLHDLANRLFRKLGRQAERQKTVMAFRGGSEDDATRLRDAEDGEGFRTDSPDSMRELKSGGVDGPNLAFLLQVKELFTYLGGNIDALGGLSPQADTLGQEEMLASGATKRIEKWKERTVQFASCIMRDVALMLWEDPFVEIPLSKRIESIDLDIPVLWTPEARRGDFLDYNIEIDPYSLSYQSPQSKLRVLTEVFERFIGPMMPMLEAQGVIVNVEGLLRTIARYTNMSELEDVLIFLGNPANAEALQQPVGSSQRGMGMPATTTRRYERVNRPGATRAGKDTALMSMLLGAGMNGGRTAQVGRGVS